jgi:hypothetical protein
MADCVPAECLRLWSLAISPFLPEEEALFGFRERGAVFFRIVVLG